MTVMVKCKQCGDEHPSRFIQSDDPNVLKNNTFMNNGESCPKCGKTST
jgi:predicted nucleic-acid-binding Zn-ribbon protein